MAPNTSQRDKRPLLSPSDANLQGHDADENGLVAPLQPLKRVRLVSLDAVRGVCPSVQHAHALCHDGGGVRVKCCYERTVGVRN
jgi:hypothetical protein